MQPLGLIYNGGKRQYAAQIVENIKADAPNALYFCDIFGGGGSVFCAAKKAGFKTFYNDFQGDLANLLRAAAFDGAALKYAVVAGMLEKFITFDDFHALKANYQKDAQRILTDDFFSVEKAHAFFQVLGNSFSSQMGSYLYARDRCDFYADFHNMIFKKDAAALERVKANYDFHFNAFFESAFFELIKPAPALFDLENFYHAVWRPFYAAGGHVEFLHKRGLHNAPSFSSGKPWSALTFKEFLSVPKCAVAALAGAQKQEATRFASDYFLRARALFHVIDFLSAQNFERRKMHLYFSNADWRDFVEKMLGFFKANGIPLNKVVFYADPPYKDSANGAYCVFKGLGRSKSKRNKDIETIFNHAAFLEYIKSAAPAVRVYFSEFGDFPQFRRVWQKAKTTYLGANKYKRVDFLY